MHVIEIFESIQGETTHAGRPCAFVRFAGCNLRCRYCDTSYAFQGGTRMERARILEALGRFKTRFVTLTGGEPLLQRELPALCADLLAGGWEVSVETHGQIDAAAIPPGVHRIFDLKTPGSGAEDRAFVNLRSVRPEDELKVVVTSEADFRWAADVVRRFELEGKLPIVFSPAFGAVEPRELVRWLLESGLEARVGLQLHKYIWGSDIQGV
ncbi:MAG: radical SAM protein [Myxococcales bacterium]|jgi:7-carboxy-7-deazaguanine synthase